MARSDLGGVTFITAAMVDGPMGDGNWTVGLIIDERRERERRWRPSAHICSGDEGGPMALMAPLIGTFAGIERAAIAIERRAMGFSITAGDLLSHGAEGVASAARPGSETIMIDNTAHPANKRLHLARGTHSHLHAFGIDWDDAVGGHNGHYAPFDWRP